ncbi:MAG: type II toxin-antitoxin system RelE family toxin [Candidatus Helarchaeota archaeon]
MQERIREGLQVLKKDPFKARPSADIKPLKDTNPRKYRLRVGNYRIIYCVESDAVKVIELFKRERGYR